MLTHTNDIYTLSSQSGIKDLIKPTTFNYNGILELRSLDPINMIFCKIFLELHDSRNSGWNSHLLFDTWIHYLHIRIFRNMNKPHSLVRTLIFFDERTCNNKLHQFGDGQFYQIQEFFID